MKRLRVAAIGLSVALLGVLDATPAHAYHSGFVARECNKPTSWGSADMPGWRRQGSINYGLTAAGQPPEDLGRGGYQWGGGCWNANGQDDAPNDPPGLSDTGGEGGDCSGFTFKVWALRGNLGENGGFRGYDIYYYFHGPYVAESYYGGNNAGFGPLDKWRADTADAFASTTHIGIVYQHTINQTDLILQAKSESQGTLVKSETYRGNSGYNGVRRKNWTEVNGPSGPGGVPIRI